MRFLFTCESIGRMNLHHTLKRRQPALKRQGNTNLLFFNHLCLASSICGVRVASAIIRDPWFNMRLQCRPNAFVAVYRASQRWPGRSSSYITVFHPHRTDGGLADRVRPRSANRSWMRVHWSDAATALIARASDQPPGAHDGVDRCGDLVKKTGPYGPVVNS